MLDSAQETLRRLGCLEDGRITQIGRLVASHPLDAPLARFLTEVRLHETELVRDDSIALVAALSAGRSILLPTRNPSDQRSQWESDGCQANVLIRAIYQGDPDRDDLRTQSLTEARRIVSQLGGTRHPNRTPDRLALAQAAIRANPSVAYVRRRKARGFGGPGQTVEIGRESILPEDAKAIVVYDIHTSQSKGTSVTHTATCASPIPLAFLRSAHLGEPEIDRVWVKRGVLICALRQNYGGVTLAKETCCPKGPLAAQALAHALKTGSIFAGPVQQSRDRAASYALFRRLEHRNDLPPLDIEEWLQALPSALGFEDGEDLPLLSDSDCLLPWPPGFEVAERDQFARRFPMNVDVGDAAYRCTYDPGRRMVTLEMTRGRKKDPPPLSYLPAWDGWGIELRRTSNVRVLRGR
jgi:hypothetical protein